MTIIEAINKIDSLKPNGYKQSDKVRWLSELDATIKNDIIDTHADGESVSFEPYEDETPVNTVLLVPHPYDRVYVAWLQAQMDFTNGETGKYQNSMAMFNALYTDFMNYYNRKHMPKGSKIKYF